MRICLKRKICLFASECIQRVRILNEKGSHFDNDDVDDDEDDNVEAYD